MDGFQVARFGATVDTGERGNLLWSARDHRIGWDVNLGFQDYLMTLDLGSEVVRHQGLSRNFPRLQSFHVRSQWHTPRAQATVFDSELGCRHLSFKKISMVAFAGSAKFLALPVKNAFKIEAIQD